MRAGRVVLTVAAGHAVAVASAVAAPAWTSTPVGDADRLQAVATDPTGAGEVFADHRPTDYETPAAYEPLRAAVAPDGRWIIGPLGVEGLTVSSTSRAGSSAVAVNLQDAWTTGRLRVAVRRSGGWSAPVEITPRDPLPSGPLIASTVSDAGDATVAWPTRGSVHAVSVSANGPGVNTQTVPLGAGAVVSTPVLASNARGDVLAAAWFRQSSGPNRIGVALYSRATGRWTNLPSPASWQSRRTPRLSITLRDGGEGALVWRNDGRVWFGLVTATGHRPLSAQRVSAVGSASSAAVGIDRTGRTVAAWTTSTNTIGVRTRSAAGRWSPTQWQPLGRAPEYPRSELAIATAGTNRIVVATTLISLAASPSSRVMLIALTPRGATYRPGPRMAFTERDNRDTDQPMVSVNPAGRVTAAWMILSGSNAPSTIQATHGTLAP